MSDRTSLVLKVAALVAVVAALVVLGFRYDLQQLFARDRVTRWLEDAGSLAPFLYMGVMAGAIVISPIPSLPLDVAAGIYFGPVLGTLYSLIGATIGALIAFFIAKLLGRDLVERLMGGHIQFCAGCSDRLLGKVVFFSRLVPVVSFDMVSYGAGLTGMSPVCFGMTTFVGMIPLTFVYNYFGSVLVVKSWVSMVVGGVFVVLFFVLPHLIEKYDLFSLRKYFHHDDDS